MTRTAYARAAHISCYERRESDEAEDSPLNRMRGHRGSNPRGIERISRSGEQPERCLRHGRLSRSGFLRVCCCRGHCFRPRPGVDRHRTRPRAGKSGSRPMHGELWWPDVHPLRAVRRARLTRTRTSIVRGLRPPHLHSLLFFRTEESAFLPPGGGLETRTPPGDDRDKTRLTLMAPGSLGARWRAERLGRCPQPGLANLRRVSPRR